MSEAKTKPSDKDVVAFIQSVENTRRREDAMVLLELYNKITGEAPVLWGDSIIGYGTYDYHYASGRSGSWMRSGFSPRKQSLTLYVMAGFSERPDLVEKLGKVKTSKACLYINKLADVDMDVLAELIQADLDVMNTRYPQ